MLKPKNVLNQVPPALQGERASAPRRGGGDRSRSPHLELCEGPMTVELPRRRPEPVDSAPGFCRALTRYLLKFTTLPPRLQTQDSRRDRTRQGQNDTLVSPEVE